MSKKAWGGRFGQELNQKALSFSASVDVDQRLAEEDAEGSIAHVRMLAERGIVPLEDAVAIERGLDELREQVRQGEFEFSEAREDVHMNLEAALTERIGAAGGKLHTARSRNDQVATDMRLWTRRACEATASALDSVLAVLATRARSEIDLLMPGYTHLQRAQPVRLSHHLMAWTEMLGRDRGRLLDAARRMNESPLGAAALAGTTFDIDRVATARALGFTRPMQNSLDAVADRDFLVETLSALANCAVHLSRIGEELVLWSSQEFGFIEMSDAFTTGSSIMPQKKNPDMAELIRGKTGRVVGSLVSMLVMLKGLPLAYNRDMQEDKEPVFDAFDTVNDSLEVLAGCLASARFDGDRMREALRRGFADATELADYLAAKGVPFREAHHVVGSLVAQAIEQHRSLSELELSTLREAHEAFDEDVYQALDFERAVERRDLVGGPARGRVLRQVERLEGELMARDVTLEEVFARFGGDAS